MRTRYFITAAIAAAILISPAEEAQADAGDFVAGAIIGGVLGHAARNQPRKKVYRSTKSTRKVYRPKIPATQAGRQIQSSLNYFGFNAGTVDGQLGRKSRQAVSSYQAYMGYPATGQLNAFEQDLLISSYNRAQAGGYATQQQIAGNPEGTRGLLKVYRTEMAGGGAAQPGTTMVMAPQAAPQMQQQPVPQMAFTQQAPGVMAANAPVAQPMPMAPVAGGMAMAAVAPAVPSMPLAQAPAAPQPAFQAMPLAQAPAPQTAPTVTTLPLAQAPATPAPAPMPVMASAQPQVAKADSGPMPSLFGSAEPTATPASQTCDALGIGAATTFDFTAADQIADDDAALSQQFCVARGFALQAGQELGQSLGAEPEQIAQLCAVYGERLQPYVVAMGTQGSEQVLEQMASFVSDAGVAEAELSGTAQVCLAEGYANDDTGLALGSGLLLAALGQSAYGELMGHHLRQGLGVKASGPLAQDWFEMSISAAEAGEPVFAPAQPGRIAVLRRVLFPTEAATAVSTSGSPLPTFSISQ